MRVTKCFVPRSSVIDTVVGLHKRTRDKEGEESEKAGAQRERKYNERGRETNGRAS
jgi:hypothetical protein